MRYLNLHELDFTFGEGCFLEGVLERVRVWATLRPCGRAHVSCVGGGFSNNPQGETAFDAQVGPRGPLQAACVPSEERQPSPRYISAACGYIAWPARTHHGS